MVKNGKSDYTIITPSGADDLITTAKVELVDLFEQATGVKLPTMVENASMATHKAGNKYISLGETQMFKSLGEDVTIAEYTTQGCRILTKDDTIYIVGPNTRATLYSVYVFLEIYFNFDVYYWDTWDIDKGKTDVKLKDFDVKEVPDIEFRGSNAGWVRSNVANNIAYRYRQDKGSYGAYTLPIYEKPGCQGRSASWHNTDELLNSYVPKSTSEWYSDNGNQLCYTAHGDEDAYADMVQAAANKITDVLQIAETKFPGRYNVSISMEDNTSICSCEACTEALNFYGSSAGAVMIFINNVWDKVEEWMNQPENEEYKMENLCLMFFAYSSFDQAPAHWDETEGKYVVNHPDLVLNEHCGAFYCHSGGFNRMTSIYSGYSDQSLENAEKWGDILPTMWIWGYQTNFQYYTMMYDSFEHYGDDFYRQMAASNAQFVFVQNQGGETGNTGFTNLKEYLYYKLTWDCMQDDKELREKWFDAMFREAAPKMKELFIHERDWNSSLLNSKNILVATGGTGGLTSAANRANFPLPVLREEIAICNEAVAIIEETYGTVDPELCHVIKRHIYTEYVMPAWNLVTLYNSTYVPAAELNEVLLTLKEWIDDCGNFDTQEGQSGDVCNQTISKMELFA